MAILLEALAALGLDTVEVSEHDVLRGAALRYTDFLGSAHQFSG